MAFEFALQSQWCDGFDIDLVRAEECASSGTAYVAVFVRTERDDCCSAFVSASCLSLLAVGAGSCAKSINNYRKRTMLANVDVPSVTNVEYARVGSAIPLGLKYGE